MNWIQALLIVSVLVLLVLAASVVVRARAYVHWSTAFSNNNLSLKAPVSELR